MAEDEQETSERPRWATRVCVKSFNVKLIFASAVSLAIIATAANSQHQMYHKQQYLFGAKNDPPQSAAAAAAGVTTTTIQAATAAATNQRIQTTSSCLNGQLTFEISTGFIYKSASAETLAMIPGTLQLTDCLDFCLHNNSCLAINFEMGLCVLLASSAKQHPANLYSSQFPVFTIYAEKECLMWGK